MSANNDQQAGLSEFFEHFNQSSNSGIANINTVDEPVVPVTDDKPLDYYVEQAKKVAKEEPAKAMLSEPASQAVATNSTLAPVLDSTKTQQFSFCSGSGDPPPGYRISESCANCEYFCGGGGTGHCFKYDFPCASNYLCDSYERCEPMQYYSHKEDVYKFSYDLNKVDSQALSDYAEGLQGAVKNNLLAKGVSLSSLSKELHVFDKQSADLAYKLSAAITGAKVYKAFARVYSQYDADKAFQLLASAPDINTEPDKVPTYLPLFKLAQSMSSTTAEVYEQYEQLYSQKFSDTNYYQLSQSVLTDDMSGTITQPTYAGDTLAAADDYTDRLKQAAENRVKSIAAKQNRSYTQEEVQKELERIQKARPKLNISI